jgi:hypothetical protein
MVPQHVDIKVNGASLRLATDVQEVGEDRLQAAPFPAGDVEHLEREYARVRPAPGGVQIEAENIMAAGTLGVNLRWEGRLRLLTNNHVISENGNVGAAVYQPGIGGEGNRLARVSGFQPVRTQADKAASGVVFNRHDLAWCDVDETVASPEIVELGTPTGVRAPVEGEWIRLMGKRTGAVQRARVESVHLAKVLRWPDGYGDWAFFDEQIQLDHVCTQPGDSGSAYVAESDGMVVGIHVGANAQYSWGCPLPSTAFSLPEKGGAME